MSKLLIGCTWGGNNRYASIKKQICKKKTIYSFLAIPGTHNFFWRDRSDSSFPLNRKVCHSQLGYIYICALACTCRNGCVTAFYFYQPCWYRFLQSWVPFLGVAIIILIIQDGLVNDGLVSLLILRSLGSLNPHRD